MEMTQEWITQFNKKCAEFMGILYGLKQNGVVKEESKVRIHKILNLDETEGLHINHCKFHSDWNWIMEVVEVIEKNFSKYTLQWEYDEREEFAEDGKYKAYWFTLYHKDEICKNLCDLRSRSRKQAVIQAIDQFIDWYNKQNENGKAKTL